jgi:hypothetical protein
MFNGNGFLNGLTSFVLAIAGLGAVAAGGLLGGGFMKDNAEAKRIDVETKMMVEQYEMARPFQEQQLEAETAVYITAQENERARLEALHQAELNRLALEENHYAASLAASQAYETQRNQVWLEVEKSLLMAGTALLFLIGFCLVIIVSLASYKTLDFHLRQRFNSQPAYPIRRPVLKPVVLRPTPPGATSHRPRPTYINGSNQYYTSENRGIVGD